MNVEQRLEELKVQLPPAPSPGGIYKPVLVVGDMAYVSGHGPLLSDGSLIRGRVGTELDIAAAQHAARQTGLALLSSLKQHLGSLNRVVRVVKLLGMVNAAADFDSHPVVINGCSQLFVDIWGNDLGVGARSAVGMGSLPGNIAVEIEAIFQVR